MYTAPLYIQVHNSEIPDITSLLKPNQKWYNTCNQIRYWNYNTCFARVIIAIISLALLDDIIVLCHS